MKDICIKWLAILIVVLLIAIWIFVIISGISVGDYELLILTLGYIFWQIIDKKLFAPWWKASKRPKRIIKNVLILSIFMFMFSIFGRNIFINYGLVIEILNWLTPLSIYIFYKYWKIWRTLR